MSTIGNINLGFPRMFVGYMAVKNQFLSVIFGIQPLVTGAQIKFRSKLNSVELESLSEQPGQALSSAQAMSLV